MVCQESTVVTGQPVCRATAEDPPSNEMISATDINSGYTENRKDCNSDVPLCVIYPPSGFVQPRVVLTTQELLRRLVDRGVKNADIARTLNITPSRVTEMHKGLRAIKLDEAAKLVEAYNLEQEPAPRVSPLPASIARLIVLYVAAELGVDLQAQAPLVRELSEDVRAFAEFVADPQVRESTDAAAAFFQALRLRRSVSESAD